MIVTVDANSGYCFGVEFAIQMAEDELNDSGELYCLGDIVHNDMEVERLAAKGLKIISRNDLLELHDCKVLIRAHGEPPETYQLALDNNIELIDASCPVVLKLQNRVRHAHGKSIEEGGQTVIYGKKGHAEVIGLTGQTNNEALVVMDEADLDQIDFKKPITLFSQTTKSTKGFYDLKKMLEERISAANPEGESNEFKANDSICRQVSNREPHLSKFAAEHEVIVFVSGIKSSNGKALYQVCKGFNPHCYFVQSAENLEKSWFKDVKSVGICGATSTPTWLMKNVKSAIETKFDED